MLARARTAHAGRNLGLAVVLLSATLGQLQYVRPAEGGQPAPVPARTKSVFFGWASPLGDGAAPAVAINGSHCILEVQEAKGGVLCCRTGVIEQATVKWKPGVLLGDGATPACGLSGRNVAVEVHRSAEGADLWCRVGTLAGNSVTWSGSAKYDAGESPAIAINEQGVVVEAHQSPGRGELCCRAGAVQGNAVRWNANKNYASGTAPRLAVNRHGQVVEVHQAHEKSGLCCRVGQVRDGVVAWGPDQEYDSGKGPAVALTDDGLVIEVHQSATALALHQRVGRIQDNAIQWSGPSLPFDSGSNASVACNADLSVEAHQSHNGGGVWFSTSLITDRARWMQDRLAFLGSKTLRRVVLPASHDSAMYRQGFPESLARTQDQSIYGQLSGGIRYFDLRPQWHDGELFIHHGRVRGPKLAEVLDDARRFMGEGHRELVVLKFSHYEGFDDAAYNGLAGQIREKLGPWLYTSLPRGKRLAEVTLGEYVRNAGVVLVVCDGAYPLDHPTGGVWVYRDWNSTHPEQGDLRVYDRYANSVAFESMKADQFGKFDRYDGHCERDRDVPCDLFLLSWTLTPTTGVWEYAKTPNRRLGAAIAELKVPNRFGRIVNILYADYAEYARVTDAAIWLNHPSVR
jgi:hypothetical protein